MHTIQRSKHTVSLDIIRCGRWDRPIWYVYCQCTCITKWRCTCQFKGYGAPVTASMDKIQHQPAVRLLYRLAALFDTLTQSEETLDKIGNKCLLECKVESKDEYCLRRNYHRLLNIISVIHTNNVRTGGGTHLRTYCNWITIASGCAFIVIEASVSLKQSRWSRLTWSNFEFAEVTNSAILSVILIRPEAIVRSSSLNFGEDGLSRGTM